MRDDRQSNEHGTVMPGQIWLIEQGSDTAVSALDRDALTSANGLAG